MPGSTIQYEFTELAKTSANLQNATMDSFTAWSSLLTIWLVSIGILCNYTHISYSIGVQIHHPSSSSFCKTCILSPWQHSFLFVIFFADRCRILAPLEPFLNAAARQLRWRIEAWIGRLSGCLGLVGFVGSDSSFQMRSIALRHSCHNQAVCVSAMFIEVFRAKYILTKNHRTTATVSWNINFTMRWWKNRNHLGTNFHFLPNQPDEQVCTHTDTFSVIHRVKGCPSCIFSRPILSFFAFSELTLQLLPHETGQGRQLSAFIVWQWRIILIHTSQSYLSLVKLLWKCKTSWI